MQKTFEKNFPRLFGVVSKSAAPLPPKWVADWLGKAQEVDCDIAKHDLSAAICGEDFSFVCAILKDAIDLSADELHAKTSEVYDRLFKYISSLEHNKVIRMWNYIPSICAHLEDGRQRYFAFNEGRFAVMSNVFGMSAENRKKIPAASALGFDGKDLAVYALTSAYAGEQVENPKQISAYNYSKRYGPLPPCFSRAMRIYKPKSALLISGTAAITGEDTQFTNDTIRQCELTFENILNVIKQTSICANSCNDNILDLLNAVRVYIPDEKDTKLITDLTRKRFSKSVIEYVKADICRKELRVEIEGIVEEKQL